MNVCAYVFACIYLYACEYSVSMCKFETVYECRCYSYLFMHKCLCSHVYQKDTKETLHNLLKNFFNNVEL